MNLKLDFETQYLNGIKTILQEGTDRPDRTDVGNSRAIWHSSMLIDLQNGFPALTTRKVSPRIAFEETWFFLRGETDTKILEAKKINIWKGNTSRDFLDKVGLEYLPTGSLGKGYGFQWRDFNGSLNEPGLGVDQLNNLISSLKQKPNDRRHIISAWNPQQLHEMALAPCHLYQQYQILNGRLNSSFVMRSSDFIYGLPYNFMSYAFLNVAISKLLNLQPGLLGYVGMDAHIYSNQIDIANQQITRTPTKLPSITIKKNIVNLDDLLALEYSDFDILDYNPQPDFSNKPPMAV